MVTVDGALYRHAKRQLAFARTLKVIGDLDGMRAYVNAARDNWRRAKFFRR